MILDFLVRLGAVLFTIGLMVVAWREYRQAAHPNRRVLFGAVAITLSAILAVFGLALTIANPTRFTNVRAFLTFGPYLLANCIRYLTSSNPRMRRSRFRTVAALGGIVLVIVGGLLEIIGIF